MSDTEQLATLVQVITQAANEKDRDADLLDDWSSESRHGGWSTHQVDAQLAKANELRREASRLRQKLGGLL